VKGLSRWLCTPYIGQCNQTERGPDTSPLLSNNTCHEVGTSYPDCSRNRLASSRSKNRTIERSEYRAHSGGNRDRADIVDCSPTYKSYWAQRKSLAVRNGILERHWESVESRSKIEQRVLLWSRVNEVPTELHGGPSGGHLGVNKTLNKVRKGTTGSRQEIMFRSGAGTATHVQPVTAPNAGNWAKCTSTMLGPHSK
jgi:hypothetical protein